MAGFAGIVFNANHAAETEMLARGRAYFSSILMNRDWNARHGGMFVEKAPGAAANPFLQNPDLQTREGIVTFDPNPNGMREIGELAARGGGFRFHITSLEPRNPANVPDSFERRALLAFKDGNREETTIEEENGQAIFRYMAPLILEPPCLGCHVGQGRGAGEVYGGIGVSFSVQGIRENVIRSSVITGLLFLLVVATALGAIYLSAVNLRSRLRTSDLRWRFALEGAGDGVWDWSLETGDMFFSSQAKTLLGYADDEIDDRFDEWESRVHPDDLANSRGLLEQHWDGQTPVYVNEHRLRCQDGSYKWVMARGKVVEWTADGRPRRMIGTVTDIARRKEIERSLRESEAYMQALVNSVSVGIGLDDLKGRAITPNPGLLRMLGYTLDELEGRPFADFTHPDDALTEQALLAEIVSGRRTNYQIEKRYIHKDGHTVWGRLTRSAVHDDSGVIQHCVGMVEDINDRKLAEEALYHSEARLKAILDASPNGIFLKDNERRYLVVNPAYCDFQGQAPERILGRRAEDFQPSDRAERTIREDLNAFIGGPTRFEEVIEGPDGQNRHFSVCKFPVCDVEGTVIGLGGISIEITDLKAMERQLVQAQKMETVGQLTSGIAHDFNNMLQGIQGNLALARQRVEDDPITLSFIANAATAGWRGAKLTHQLLSFSRKQTLFPEEASVNDLIQGMLAMLERTLGEDILVETVLAGDLPPIHVDASGLENSILNLAVNARTAMPAGGVLTLTTGARHLKNDLSLDSGETLPAGDYVEIALSDTGQGMTAEVLEHAFEPFFTTKEVGEGSGLGLSMVYGFARQSAGHVILESQPGRGTAVRLLLPVAEADDSASDGTLTTNNTASIGTILVVEDDPDVRQSVVLMLATMGYLTKEAETGTAALSILESDPAIDLLFSDAVMPEGLSGFDLAEEAVRRRPGLKILLTSGHPDSRLHRAASAGGGFFQLAKPFSAETLATAVAAALVAGDA